MSEFVNDDIIQSLNVLKEHLEATNPKRKINTYEYVYHEQLREDMEGTSGEDNPAIFHENEIVHFEHMPSVMELLELMGHWPLKYQIYMICNLLTVSGFTQAEIAAELGIAHKTYRNALLEVRKDFRDRTGGTN